MVIKFSICRVLFLLFLTSGFIACEKSQTESLFIITKDEKIHFQVEVAQTREEKKKGLMHRQTLAPDAGMLFEYETAKKVSMWMKNTHVSLDMLFIDKEGVIRFIHQKTTPESREKIQSPVNVSAVLEINAGLVEKFNIRQGDRIENDFFSR